MSLPTSIWETTSSASDALSYGEASALVNSSLNKSLRKSWKNLLETEAPNPRIVVQPNMFLHKSSTRQVQQIICSLKGISILVPFLKKKMS